MNLQKELGLQSPFKDIRHEAVLNIVRTANQFAAKAAQLFRQFDLTEAQFNVLFSLKFATEDITQAELGKRLVVTRASITSVLDKLESKNLVKRVDVPNNRRIHHVVLTDEGLDLIVKAEPVYREEIYHIMADLELEDCQQLISHLELIRGRVITQTTSPKN